MQWMPVSVLELSIHHAFHEVCFILLIKWNKCAIFRRKCGGSSELDQAHQGAPLTILELALILTK